MKVKNVKIFCYCFIACNIVMATLNVVAILTPPWHWSNVLSAAFSLAIAVILLRAAPE